MNRSGPDRVQIAPSCSLLHVPVDLDEESNLDPQIRNWLAFAKQKLAEVKLLARAVTDASLEFAGQFRENRQVLAERRKAQRVYDPAVRKRVAAIVPGMFDRPSNSAVRATRLSRVTPLPLLPVTTIGSFPQTREVRQARAAYRSGTLSQTQYEDLLRNEIKRAIRIQEEIGLDVLVHGEFERNDMVEYFAEQLNGFLLTSNGWVQSYGSRCVKPPILFGDVSRPQPMTVAWAVYAQSLTKLPVKGMLTGPVTMLEWSFVRDDLTRGEVCFQIALALRDEVKDLESAGIRVIQVDEPALREGLPLRKAAHSEYLQWSVDAFRLVTAVASDEIQIHTHMCYSEFREILDVLKRMDADVISIEAARSEMELLNEFTGKDYPNNIGPGVYDIHSPRIPSSEEVEARVGKALRVFRQDRLWVNPDCGLKTRRWEEVRGALINMVAAAPKTSPTYLRLSGESAERGAGMVTANKESEIRESLALCAKDLVSYQEGSIVSRTLLKRQTGNVTLFAFDDAQCLSEHTSPFDALVHVLEGDVEISIDGKPLRAASGDMVLMPADHPHALKALTRFKMVLTMIRS